MEGHLMADPTIEVWYGILPPDDYWFEDEEEEEYEEEEMKKSKPLVIRRSCFGKARHLS